MNRHYLLKMLLILITFFSVTVSATEEDPAAAAAPAFSYFTLEPDITTNFYSRGKNLGYIQIRIDIMVTDSTDLRIIERHQPLLRDTIINILGKQSLESIRSLTGREELRKKMVTELNNVLLPEAGKTVIADILFTKYLYQ